MPLVKQADGSFELTVPLPTSKDILYKYVVDGEWLVSDNESKGKDENGIENNLLSVATISSLSKGTKIPESGGLPVGTGSAKTTVMPREDPKQVTLGEPGIFIPKEPEELAAFATVRDVGCKTRNEEPALTHEEKQKQKKKLKRTQYKARQKQKKAAAAAAATVGATGTAVTHGSESESSPYPEHTEGGASSEAEPETTNDEQIAEEEAAAPVANNTVAPVKSPFVEPKNEPLLSVAPQTKAVVSDVSETEAVVPAAQKKPAAETLDPAIVGALGAGTIPAAQDAETTKDPVAMTPKEPAAKEVDALPIKKNDNLEGAIFVTNGGKSAKEISDQIASTTGQEVEQIQPPAAEAKEIAQQVKKAETEQAECAKKAGVEQSKKAKSSKHNKTEGKEKKKGFFSKLKKIFK